MRIRVLVKAASVAALIVAVLMGWLWYAFLGHRHVTAQARPADFRSTADALQSTNAPLILAAADHFYWLNNGPAAAPLYARAEKLFSEKGDNRNERHAQIGRLRSEAETMSFVDLSRYLDEQLQTPLLRNDKDLRLWGLIAKGYPSAMLCEDSGELFASAADNWRVEGWLAQIGWIGSLSHEGGLFITVGRRA